MLLDLWLRYDDASFITINNLEIERSLEKLCERKREEIEREREREFKVWNLNYFVQIEFPRIDREVGKRKEKRPREKKSGVGLFGWFGMWKGYNCALCIAVKLQYVWWTEGWTVGCSRLNHGAKTLVCVVCWLRRM